MMTSRASALVTSFMLLAACTGRDAQRRAEPPLECQKEVVDGCLFIRTPISKGPWRYHSRLTTNDGELVHQYGITPRLHMGRGDTFERPLEPGNYVLSIFRGGPNAFSETSDEVCGRPFRIRTQRAQEFRVAWEGKKRCIIERLRRRR